VICGISVSGSPTLPNSAINRRILTKRLSLELKSRWTRTPAPVARWNPIPAFAYPVHTLLQRSLRMLVRRNGNFMEELAELAPTGNRRVRDNQEMPGAGSHRNIAKPLRYEQPFHRKVALK